MNKKEAKEFLLNQKELKGFVLYSIELYNDNYIVFAASKGRYGYYGIYDNGLIELEKAGLLSELQ